MYYIYHQQIAGDMGVNTFADFTDAGSGSKLENINFKSVGV